VFSRRGALAFMVTGFLLKAIRTCPQARRLSTPKSTDPAAARVDSACGQ
jgi:hypothetical protein